MRLSELTFCLVRTILPGSRVNSKLSKHRIICGHGIHAALLVPDRLFSGPLCGHHGMRRWWI